LYNKRDKNFIPSEGISVEAELSQSRPENVMGYVEDFKEKQGEV